MAQQTRDPRPRDARPDGAGPHDARPHDARLHDPDRGVYGISVAAELVGMAVPSLRLYESQGLVEPDRTPGGTRRYSVNDVERLRGIGELLEAGVNLTGIAMIQQLQQANDQLRRRCEELEARLAAEGLPPQGPAEDS